MRTVALTGASIICMASALSAQSPQPDRVQLSQIDALESAVHSLEKQVAELNSLLRAALPRSPVIDVTPFEVKIGEGPFKGSAEARVALIEFADFECPFCRRHAQTVYPDLLKQFVDSGKVRYMFRHLPLPQLHASALKAAEAAECARDQGRFWDMHERLFSNQRALTPTDLKSHAVALKMDLSQFEVCLTSGAMADKVAYDQNEAQRLGLTGTPSFLIGELTADGNVRVTKTISGAHPLAVFQTALQSALAASSTK